MGFANSTYGFGYAAILVTAPQLLAAHGVAQPVIAGMTALATAVSLAVFVLAPVLDTLISRRAWSIGLALVGAALTTLALLLPARSPWLGAMLPAAALTFSLYNAAVGGWLGAALPKSCDATISTWFTIGNSTGFGIGALIQFWLLAHLPAGGGALVVGVATLVPLAFLPLIPATDLGRKAMGESFGALARDLSHLVRQGLVLRILLMFLLPCAAFTLTNAFGGLGPDFHASDGVVGVANGVGAVLIGLGASLLARLILKRFSAPLAYLSIGVLGAAFTLALVALPHTPSTYILAVLGENAAQSIAQVSQNAIIFRSIPQGSPLASSQFGLLSTAFGVPYAYMLAMDGYGYKLAGGVAGSFVMDAGLSLAACLILVWPVMRWLAAGKLEVGADDEGASRAAA
ncbi:MAG TPA: MFS transporter [Caulobacteraceae bacterium]|nr:MFS transporter [Caulobacteraceae bacterium]